jgi:5'-nucleotidase (lipoprotein e(P4) family)
MIELRRRVLCGLAALAVSAAPAMAEDPPQSDLLNATLWMQRSVEFKATALAGFALAHIRLEQALADKSWTGAPGEQTGNYQDLPPAVILDIDETLLDNSGYQAWMVLNNTTFDPKTWNQFVKAEIATPIPGAVEFSKFAEAKGVKVFYISNRTGEEEEATRRNMERYGFPMGGNVDTFLMSRERTAQCRRQFRRLPRRLSRQRGRTPQGL